MSSNHPPRRKASRRYSERTLKVLFGTATHCAFPDCTNPIVQPGTGVSRDLVMGQIAHIAASSDIGPRANLLLSARERDQPENLLLLCPNHHVLVDGQHEIYPEPMLRDWKKEQVQQAARAAALISPKGASAGGAEFVNRELLSAVTQLRRARYYVGIDAEAEARALAARITDGDFSLALPSARSEAFGWCARVLAYKAEAEELRGLSQKAAGFVPSESLSIARAFLASAEGDEAAAMSALAYIDSAAARTAGFQVVRRHRELEGAVEWLEASGLTSADLDPDGRLVLILAHLTAGAWTDALKLSDELSEVDFEEQPALFYAAALINLLQAVPEDLRPFVRAEVPLEARRFPLSSDPDAMERRRTAEALFARGAATALALGAEEAAGTCEIYAAWIRLRNPRQEDAARSELGFSRSERAPHPPGDGGQICYPRRGQSDYG